MVLAVSVVVLLVLSLFSIGLSFSPSSSSSSSYGNRLIALTNRSYKTKQIASSSLLSSLSSPPSTSISSSSISEDDAEENVIKISDKAREHLKALTLKQGGNTMCLRMGVRAGGCSGMSYVMDFVSENDITTDDHIEEYDGVKCVVDPKSLMFLYGLQLDYSDELIGGGFKFNNPNAESSCGCGKSFGV